MACEILTPICLFSKLITVITNGALKAKKVGTMIKGILKGKSGTVSVKYC